MLQNEKYLRWKDQPLTNRVIDVYHSSFLPLGRKFQFPFFSFCYPNVHFSGKTSSGKMFNKNQHFLYLSRNVLSLDLIKLLELINIKSKSWNKQLQWIREKSLGTKHTSLIIINKTGMRWGKITGKQIISTTARSSSFLEVYSVISYSCKLHKSHKKILVLELEYLFDKISGPQTLLKIESRTDVFLKIFAKFSRKFF